MLTSYIKTKTENSTEYEQKRLLLIEEYEKYKGYIDFPDDLKGKYIFIGVFHFYVFSDYEWRSNLRFLRIYFDTPTFDRITKDRAAKFVDMLSAIGGTMGLLTGFSIISGVEILFILFSYIIDVVKSLYSK